jgi:hypothetical protein
MLMKVKNNKNSKKSTLWNKSATPKSKHTKRKLKLKESRDRIRRRQFNNKGQHLKPKKYSQRSSKRAFTKKPEIK